MACYGRAGTAVIPGHAMMLSRGAASGGGAQRWGISSYAANGAQFAATTNNNLGWVFTPTQNLSCNALRAIAVIVSASIWRVSLYRNSDSVVIATADIALSSSDTWVVAAVSPFTLQSGVAYTIAARTTSGSSYYRRNNTYAYGSGFNASPTGSATGSSDARPTGTSSNTYRGMDFGLI